MNKSVMMPMNLVAEKMPLKNFPFTWNPGKVVYLGLNRWKSHPL